jgi:CHRD domain
MRYRRAAAILVPLVAVAVVAATALADEEGHTFNASLTGYREVPAVNSSATGTLTALVSSDQTTITYTLTYSGFTTAPTVAHLHFAQKGVAGGVVAFLCGGGGKPDCPPSGSVSGTITAADIQAVPAQGIAAGDLTSVLRAMRAKRIYVNVHTPNFPNGEIRGQVH